MTEQKTRGISGAFADLYDVFVDWPGRLGRELPGLLSRLSAVGAERVLDVGCGTGRHVEALVDAGLDACGADPSDDMLAQAAELVGRERVFAWGLGDGPSAELRRASPFDAAIAMGNVWPQVLLERDARAGAEALRELVRPGGLVLLGLKAFAVREASGNPYLPLLRREHDGAPLWFVRFVDFDEPPLEDGTRVAGFHMVVVGGGDEAKVHRSGRVRVWDPTELTKWLEERGFDRVEASGKLDDPGAPVTTEDVFVEARVPG